MTKPKTAAEYTPQQLHAARAACYDLVTTLGDMLQDLVIVGGLVPSLLIERGKTAGEAHVGTTDLDLGLQVGLLRDAHYHRLASRLRDRGFEPASDDAGEPLRYRWVSRPRGAHVDFLVPQRSLAKGKLVAVDENLEAIATPGLQLAFKDAYDIYYLLRHYGVDVEVIVGHLKPLLDDGVAREAIGYLHEDFAQLDSIGPSSAAAFLGRSDDEGFRADVAGVVQRLVRGLQ